MITFRYYDKENRKDYAWYESSNIVHSECDDNLNDFKTLRIVFKTGDAYEYKKVDVNDYLMFMAGGLDGSNGKAFYKFIRPKYEAEKLNKVDFGELAAKLDELKAKKAAEKANEENKPNGTEQAEPEK